MSIGQKRFEQAVLVLSAIVRQHNITRIVARVRSKYLELLLQEGQKLLPHEVVAERLGEGSDVAEEVTRSPTPRKTY